MNHDVPRTACPQYRDSLVDYSDNELPATERADLENHVATCPACQAELARLDSSLARLASGFTTVDLGARGSRRAVTVNREAGSAGASPSRWKPRAAAAIAAIGLICTISGWWLAPRPIEISKASEPPVVAAPKLSQHDALWQIALIEQQARLQSSLDLLPAGALSSDEREHTQTIVQQLHNARIDRGDSL